MGYWELRCKYIWGDKRRDTGSWGGGYIWGNKLRDTGSWGGGYIWGDKLRATGSWGGGYIWGDKLLDTGSWGGGYIWGDKLRDLHWVFWICHFQYISLHSVIIVSFSFHVFLQSLFGVWYVNFSFSYRYVKLLLSFCSVMFFCRSSAVFLVIFLCHCLLSCCSVLFSAIFCWRIHLAFCSCNLQSCFAQDFFLTWAGKDMREEGRRRRMRVRRRRSGLHTNSNNPTLKGGEKSIVLDLPTRLLLSEIRFSTLLDLQTRLLFSETRFSTVDLQLQP